MNPSPVSSTTAGLAVAGCTGLAVFGPLVGLSPAWIALLVGGGLLGLTLDASQLEGMGGHLLAEALPFAAAAFAEAFPATFIAAEALAAFAACVGPTARRPRGRLTRCFIICKR